MDELRIYSTALRYVYADVNTDVDPTGDVVALAFIPLDQAQPDTADWVAGGWRTVGSGLTVRYQAKCLVGPGGTVQLDPGLYQVFVRITDNPEIPVDQAVMLLRVV